LKNARDDDESLGSGRDDVGGIAKFDPSDWEKGSFGFKRSYLLDEFQSYRDVSGLRRCGENRADRNVIGAFLYGSVRLIERVG
jgi:hypothetical protein